MKYADRIEQDVRTRIVNDLANHTISVLRNDGMYRHWRCQKPGTWCMGFDIVTWPGSLCFTGDMGTYLFQRTNDMVAFMRDSCMSYSYAAEKCVAHDGRLEAWSPEVFHEVMDERLRESDDGQYTVMIAGERKQRSIATTIEDIKRAYADYESEHDAIKAMYESRLWDGCDLPSCKTYTFHFLWCLHAIHWFCQKISGKELMQK